VEKGKINIKASKSLENVKLSPFTSARNAV